MKLIPGQEKGHRLAYSKEEVKLHIYSKHKLSKLHPTN